VLRQAWEPDDAGKAETLLRNLARRLEKDWEGVSASILEGLDEMLAVRKLGLPPELRRSLACTNIIENVMGTVRRVCRNVKYWCSPSMALRWAGAAMQVLDKSLSLRRSGRSIVAAMALFHKCGRRNSAAVERCGVRLARQKSPGLC
jgi:transposase-like protein